MRKRPRSIAMALAVAVSALSCRGAPPPALGHFNAHFGYREMRGNGWTPHAGQKVAAFDADWRPPRWPLWIAGGLGVASDIDHPTDGFLFESSEGHSIDLWGGVRHYFAVPAPIEPYVGLGAAVVFTRKDSFGPVDGGFRGTISDKETVFGGAAEAGVLIRAPHGWHLGIAGRIFRGPDIDVFGIDSSADFDQVTVFLGTSW